MADTDNVELKFVEVTGDSKKTSYYRHNFNYLFIWAFWIVTIVQLVLLGDFGFARFSAEKVVKFKNGALDTIAPATYNASWYALNTSKTTALNIRKDIFGLKTDQKEASATDFSEAIDYTMMVCNYVMKLHFFTASVLSLTLFLLIFLFWGCAVLARSNPFARKLTQTLLIVIEHLVFAFVIVALYLLVENGNSKNYYTDFYGTTVTKPSANCLEINWGHFPEMHGNYYPHDINYLVLFIFQFAFACIVTLFTLYKWVSTFLIPESENKQSENGPTYAPAMMLVHAVP